MRWSAVAPPIVREVLLAALVLPLGCASRRVPATFPASSAASDRASEAPPAVVTASFADEQPPPADAPDPHAGHHGGHHGR